MAIVNIDLVSKTASLDGVNVMLSGLGGDELFGGWRHFLGLESWSFREVIRLLRNLIVPHPRKFESLMVFREVSLGFSFIPTVD